MQNESWYPDDYNPCDGCPDWDDVKGCKSNGNGCNIEVSGAADNECFN